MKQTPAPVLFLLAFSLVGLSACLTRPASAQDAAVSVLAGDARIRYVGRWDTHDAGGPRCAWSASTVLLTLRGAGLSVRLADSGHDFWQVVVDGRPTTVLELQSGASTYPLAADLSPGVHQIALIKRTEPFVGVTQVLGFSLPVGSALVSPPPPARRRLEIVGDSITCGYGNEGKNEKERFSPATEDAYLAYGPVAARALGAECTLIAWSGRKMWPDNTTPEIYDRTLPADPTSRWDFHSWIPDAVVINLATNDFGRENPDEAGWTQAYEDFIARIRRNYPQSQIYCAAGPMMTDNWPPGHNALTTLRRYLNRIVADEQKAGDKRVHFLEFAAQDGARDGLGADYHPSLKTDQRMADALDQTLQHDLGWSAPPPGPRE